MKRLLVALIFMIAACGQPPAHAGASPAAQTPTPSATPTVAASPGPSSTPSASGPLLFPVLEAKGTANAYTWNTVAIAGLDGFARAKTTFVPMPVPKMGCMGAVLSQSAHVAAGKVYFADGNGVVRSLSVSGQVTKVATFPLTSSQQMLSFAVSPDGSRLLGTVFTLPAKPNLACNGSPATGYGLDVYSALAGGPSKLLYHQTMQTSPSSVMALTGWDAIGPVGTSPTVWATQGGGPGSEVGVAVRIDAGTGKVLDKIGTDACTVWHMAFSGDYACTEASVTNSAGTYDAKVSVRRVDGSEIWHATLMTDDGFVYDPQLAPDEAHVAAGINSATAVVGRGGGQIKIGFFASGWLNSSTLIGNVITASPNPNLAYVGLSAPGKVVSLGFPGLFVGTVRT